MTGSIYSGKVNCIKNMILPFPIKDSDKPIRFVNKGGYWGIITNKTVVLKMPVLPDSLLSFGAV